MISKTVENYLKNIFLLSENNKVVTTNEISKKLKIKASSASDMLKKLKDKGLLNYEKYNGVSLTVKGKKIATTIVRKHRLWETFLVKKLNFKWDEVHEVAEQLEHIDSEKLVSLLDNYLGYPEFDPHGDPIPNTHGTFPKTNSIAINKLKINEKGTVMGVLQDNKEFLMFLNKIGLNIGSFIQVKNILKFDDSIEIKINKKEYLITLELARNILVKKEEN
ncbi:MAG: iron-dependent repressor [Flavobacteriales bacterium]|nr:iron-dependent repressor [Flavobacteriales bacterium]|tara:strand:- start:85 stop:744 length:660 start_codon:yes stop_codon:yes gene_type:complete